MKTVFLELLDVPAHEKGASLKSMICSQRPQRTHEVDVSGFAAIPKSPFAYWASAGLRRAFLDHPALQESALVASGTGTLDDFRFVRLWVECPPSPFTYPSVCSIMLCMSITEWGFVHMGHVAKTHPFEIGCFGISEMYILSGNSLTC